MIPNSIYSQAFGPVALRTGLLFFGIACVALVAGVSSLLLARLRARDRLLLWVGIFSVLYAARLFLLNQLFRSALLVSWNDVSLWANCLTCLIPIPFALFARELVGRGWRSSIAIWLWVEIAFATISVPTLLLTHLVSWPYSLNSALIIVGTLLLLFHVLLGKQAQGSFASSLQWPLIAFGAVVLSKNVGFVSRVDMEPVGFLFLLAGLGSTAARRALASERKLIDVEGELATATLIQKSIIPHSPPYLPGLRIATRYQPMTAVAGDFFDFLQTGQHCLSILVADVSGHGVPAALVASMLKVCFAAQREQATSPAAVLTGLNTMLRGSLGGQYVTAACAAIDLQARTITYAGAGHPPSLLLRKKSCSVVALSENGLFIGPFAQAVYANISVPFEIGDKLLLYTDGIIEATGPNGQEFGRENLENLLRKGADLAPATFIEQLFAAIASPSQQDDLTVVFAQFEA